MESFIILDMLGNFSSLFRFTLLSKQIMGKTIGLQKGDKKLISAWAFYDWANSVYSLVISTAVFPIYYATITQNFESYKLTEKIQFGIQKL